MLTLQLRAFQIIMLFEIKKKAFKKLTIFFGKEYMLNYNKIFFICKTQVENVACK